MSSFVHVLKQNKTKRENNYYFGKTSKCPSLRGEKRGSQRVACFKVLAVEHPGKKKTTKNYLEAKTPGGKNKNLKKSQTECKKSRRKARG